MSPTRMMELLNTIVDRVAHGKDCEDTIVTLLWMGFTGEELYEYFSFNLFDVVDAEDVYDNLMETLGGNYGG